MVTFKGTREAFSVAMLELAEQDSRYVLVLADSLAAMRAARFAERYPERVFDVGIAEQNAVGVAAGLASCGLIPFVATYAGFITMRACEQVRTFCAYPGLNVKFVGANGGLFAGEREGVTHQFFEDLGIMRSIPCITIVTPSDPAQTRQATHAIAQVDGPCYLRIGSGREHDLFKADEPFELGKLRVLAEHGGGEDVALIATGLLLNRVQEAAERLATEGISATVAEVHTLRPLDREAIAAVARRTGAVVTIEDHNILGGLGSAVAEVIAEEGLAATLVRVGLQDVFPESGEAESLLDAYGMGITDVMAAARRAMKRARAH